MEVVNGATRTGLSIREWLVRGAATPASDSLPGTAAEILDDDVRWVLTKGKLPTRRWIEVVNDRARGRAADELDDDVRPRRHPGALGAAPELLARHPGAQPGARPAAFTEFVALPFVHHNAPIYLAGVARPGPTARDNLAVHALARLLLHGRIDNIQTSWVKLGVEGTRAMLRAGVNDLGGTLMEETISRMAGSSTARPRRSPSCATIAEGIGRPVRQRTTTYGPAPRRSAA